ncbi:hypothetical protein Tco_1005567 [Tanacetum coccineum]|uniref:Reverse transcriptase domain-containing protein n=1 Tax=Tanacetum coccineum TaxID=301880 RepID=A0ABQ5FG53_9ASTR
MTGPTSDPVTPLNRVIECNDNQDNSPSLQDQILSHMSLLETLIRQHNERAGTPITPIRLTFTKEGEGNKGKDNNKGPEREKDEDHKRAYKEVLKSPFTRRIIEFSALNHRMPVNLKLYDGSTDPDDHITRFVGAANQGDGEMSVWCRMFQQTLDGSAKGWFDRMPNGCIDNWTDLRERLAERFTLRRKCSKDPIEVSKIIRMANETLPDFKECGTEEMVYIQGVPEVMQISAFMTNSKCPELARRFADQVPQTVTEMIKRVDDFVKSEEAYKSMELPKGEHPEKGQRTSYKGRGYDVAITKRRRHDFHSDDVTDLAMASECSRLKEDLESSTWRRKDFAKSVKAISLPQDVPSTSDRRLIELENQVQRLMEAYLAPKQPIQVNKITSSCEIGNGPHDTHYYMENPELGNSKPFDTLADLGSCMNIIPLYLIKKLNIGLLEESDHVFGLADGTKSYPIRIKDPETPLLVGREFLATRNAVIDYRKAKIAVGEGITRSIFEDIGSIIDPRVSQVVLGNPFVEISNMTHDPPKGVVRFTNVTDEIAYKISPKIDQYNSLSDLAKEHTKTVYLRNEENKRRGVEYVMSKILGFNKECLELGPEYLTRVLDEEEVT